jgi:hypothetical protein
LPRPPGSKSALIFQFRDTDTHIVTLHFPNLLLFSLTCNLILLPIFNKFNTTIDFLNFYD